MPQCYSRLYCHGLESKAPMSQHVNMKQSLDTPLSLKLLTKCYILLAQCLVLINQVKIPPPPPPPPSSYDITHSTLWSGKGRLYDRGNYFNYFPMVIIFKELPNSNLAYTFHELFLEIACNHKKCLEWPLCITARCSLRLNYLNIYSVLIMH